MNNSKNYDAKNMMHTFRLFNMAQEIASEGILNVRRPDREFLLEIRNGSFQYEELVSRANDKMIEVNELFSTSTLQDKPDMVKVENILSEMREELYSK